MRKTTPLPFLVAASLAWVVLAGPGICRAQQFEVSADRPAAIYKVGDVVHWIVRWEGGGTPPHAQYVLKSGGLKEVGHGEVRLEGGVGVLESRFDGPGTMLAVVTWKPGPEGRAVGGAVADPGGIAPAAKEPADFGEFWRGKLKELEGVPANPKLERGDSEREGVAYWKVTLDNVGGTHIQGQLAKPEKGGKFPAVLIPQWAGVYGLDKNWVTDFAAKGWLALDIEAHDIPIDRPKGYYKALFDGPLKGYWEKGNDDRDGSYFLRMYLSCTQALEYLRGRPDWNGKTLVVSGASQGGMQALMVAGLHPDEVTAVMALVPAGCDMLAPEVGRAPGWPAWYDLTKGKDPAKVRETSRYFDSANFARRIRCPALIGLGLRDEVATPSSILAAAHEVRGLREVVIMPKSPHSGAGHAQKAYEETMWDGWLPALRDGKAPIGGTGSL